MLYFKSTCIIDAVIVAFLCSITAFIDPTNYHEVNLSYDIENFLYDQFIIDYDLFKVDRELSSDEKNATIQTLKDLTDKVITESLASDIKKNNYLFAQAGTELYGATVSAATILALIALIPERIIAEVNRIKYPLQSPYENTQKFLFNTSSYIAKGCKYSGILSPVALVHLLVVDVGFMMSNDAAINQVISAQTSTAFDFLTLLIAITGASAGGYFGAYYGYQHIKNAQKIKQDLEKKALITQKIQSQLNVVFLPC